MQIAVENLAEIRRTHAADSLVMTHGVFDILHPGHLDRLEVAKSIGNIVSVAIWSNEHVTRRKGANRPYVDIADRMRIIDSLDTVDYVFEVPARELAVGVLDPIVAAAKPDFYVLADSDPLFGGEPYVVHDDGRTTSFVYDLTYRDKATSTSEIIERIQANAQPSV